MAAAERRRPVPRPKGGIVVVKVEVLADGRMDRANAAKYLGRSPQTLRIWAMRGIGTRPHTIGGRAYYYLADIENYVAGRARRRRHGGNSSHVDDRDQKLDRPGVGAPGRISRCRSTHGGKTDACRIISQIV